MKNNKDILYKAEKQVKHILDEQLDEQYRFHDFSHTNQVVDECKKLATLSKLSELETEQLLLAAWFHDAGYIGGSENHEQRSSETVKLFLEVEDFEADYIQTVVQIILDTKWPQQPTTELGKLLCDADLSGLASDHYYERSHHLRKEMDALYGGHSDSEWIAKEVEFLSEHKYLTEIARLRYDADKLKNLNQLKTLQNELKLPEPEKEKSKSKKKGKRKKEKAAKDYGRGVETMFRAAARTHINLSSMADSKANIMLTINAMVVSIILTVLMPKLDTNPHLIIPAVVLLLTCLIAMLLATLSTRPNVSNGRSSKDDIENKRSNLLFLGNFHDMELDEYEWGMKEMMKDNDFLYGSLTRDLYFLGKVLDKKYRYLRLCYTVFMIGMVLSVIAFGVAIWKM